MYYYTWDLFRDIIHGARTGFSVFALTKGLLIVTPAVFLINLLILRSVKYNGCEKLLIHAFRTTGLVPLSWLSGIEVTYLVAHLLANIEPEGYLPWMEYRYVLAAGVSGLVSAILLNYVLFSISSLVNERYKDGLTKDRYNNYKLKTVLFNLPWFVLLPIRIQIGSL